MEGTDGWQGGGITVTGNRVWRREQKFWEIEATFRGAVDGKRSVDGECSLEGIYN